MLEIREMMSRLCKKPKYSFLLTCPSWYSPIVAMKINKNEIIVIDAASNNYNINHPLFKVFIKERTVKILDIELSRSTEYTFNSLIKKGLINSIRTRMLRGSLLIQLNNIEIVPFKGLSFKIDNGKLISKVPKKYQRIYNEIIDRDKRIKNTLARNRYHNSKARARLHKARETNDMSILEINDVFKLRNVFDRRTVIEYFGIEKIINSLKHKIIDRKIIDGRSYELIKLQMPKEFIDIANPFNREQDYALYLKMINPSTKEVHFEGIPNKGTFLGINEETVMDALAWRDEDESHYLKPKILT